MGLEGMQMFGLILTAFTAGGCIGFWAGKIAVREAAFVKKPGNTGENDTQDRYYGYDGNERFGGGKESNNDKFDNNGDHRDYRLNDSEEGRSGKYNDNSRNGRFHDSSRSDRNNRYSRHERWERHERKHPGEKRILAGSGIGSPASGKVSTFQENGKKGIRILPDSGKIYAPASGKIIKLYPMGSRMCLRTDGGTEILIEAGSNIEEADADWYRSRIVQNEVVDKGKLLLEYDMQAIEEQGGDNAVFVSMADTQKMQEVEVTSAPYVKTGQEIMWLTHDCEGYTRTS